MEYAVSEYIFVPFRIALLDEFSVPSGTRTPHTNATHRPIYSLDFPGHWCTLFDAGEIRLGRTQVKKLLITVLMMATPAMVAAQSGQSGTSETQSAPTTGSS